MICDCGGVAMAKEQSSSQVSLSEFITVSATLTNDASYMRLHPGFNTTSVINLYAEFEKEYTVCNRQNQ